MTNISSRIYCLVSLFFLLASSAYQTVSAQPTAAYFNMELYGHSETSALTQIVLDDFEGPDFNGGNLSFTHNTWELGARYKNFKIASIARYDYHLSYSEDVAELTYSEKNDLSIETNRTYLIDLNAFHSRATGIKLGYEYSFIQPFKMGVDVSILNSSSFLDGSLKGKLRVNDDSYSGKITLDQVYSTDKLLDRVNSTPTAKGYSLDLYVDWQPSDDIHLSAKWIDLKSALTLERTPFTSAVANSERVSLGDNDRVDVKPILNGREGFRKYTLKFPKQFRLNSTYKINNKLSMGLQAYRYAENAYLSITSDLNITPRQKLMSAFDFKTHALTLGLRSNNWRFSLTTDKFDFNKARTFGVSTGIHIEI